MGPSQLLPLPMDFIAARRFVNGPSTQQERESLFFFAMRLIAWHGVYYRHLTQETRQRLSQQRPTCLLRARPCSSEFGKHPEEI